MSIKSFESEIRSFAKSSALDTDIVIRKIALDLYNGITQKTPVDTGRAKGNWNISVSRKDETINDNATSTSFGNKGTPKYTVKKGDGLRDIYITNSLPYIYALEGGHSGQAPSGMVELTINEVRTMFL